MLVFYANGKVRATFVNLSLLRRLPSEQMQMLFYSVSTCCNIVAETVAATFFCCN